VKIPLLTLFSRRSGTRKPSVPGRVHSHFKEQ
jgi:hypothetical protein